MKLHRLALTNYRGIAHREIHLPDSGVVVICGANEIGKTSMIEALDLLLDFKDRSAKKEVKQVKPTHADVGSEVLAEISTGPYRFVYRKRFHKRCETELTISSPRREQLTGDEAHERVLAMLAETVDTDLWHAQRVLQTNSTSAVDLSECDALSRALDVAAGDDAALSGNEPGLIERIDAEYERYFTGTGRPTGELAHAMSLLSKAEEELDRCVLAVDEIDERVRLHGELTARMTRVNGERASLTERAALAEQAAVSLVRLTEQLEGARLVAAAAQATSAVSGTSYAERLRLQSDFETRKAAFGELKVQHAASQQAESASGAQADAAAASARDAERLVTAGQARLDRAKSVAEACAAREEIDRLSARLNRIDSAQGDLDQVAGQLDEITLTEQMMHDIESAATAVQRLEAQLALTSAAIEFTATVDLQLTVDGQPVLLEAGETWTPPTSSQTTLEMPGVFSFRIDPGASAADLGSKLTVAQRLQNEILFGCGVADVEAAREVDERRRQLAQARSQIQARMIGLAAGDDVELLRVRLATVQAALLAGQGLLEDGFDLEAAKAERTEAEGALAQATSAAQAQQAASAEANRIRLDNSTRTTILSERMIVEGGELAAVQQRLAALRAEATDEELGQRAQADVDVMRRAEDHLAELLERHTAADPAAVDAELALAQGALEEFNRTVSELEQMLNDISVELAVMGNDGRQSNLDAARSAYEHAAAEHSRVSSRATAARTLRAVLARHRDDTRLRYVEPFRAEMERIGRPVFGPTFEVEVDSGLRICSRTLLGRTVPFDSLSSGAKEQLGILARLAGAALVAKDDSVPVVIDDALGFTDPERLNKMVAVFNDAGDQGQIIVLTCMPSRYLGVDAHHIELVPSQAAGDANASTSSNPLARQS